MLSLLTNLMVHINSEIKQFLSKPKRQIIFFLLLGGLTVFNTINLVKSGLKLTKIKKIIPYQFDGYKFSGLQETFKNVKYIGYYTDKDLKETKALQQFSQAQYILAPVILDPDSTDYPYILFDCSTDDIALKKIKELDVIPLKKNKFGIILARRK